MKSSELAALSLLQCLAPFGEAAGQDHSDAIRKLTPGTSDQRYIQGCAVDVESLNKQCQEHLFVVELPASGYWLLQVEQIGIDLVVSVAARTSEQTVTVDTPIDRIGAESVLMHADTGGAYELRVSTEEHPKARGRYTLRVDELPSIADEDRLRIDAEAAMTKAAKLHVSKDRTEAASQYERAITLWREVGDRAQEAKAAYSLGALYLEADPSAALSTLEAARDLYRSFGQSAPVPYVLRHIGIAWEELAETDKAEDAYEEVLAMSRALGDRYAEALALNHLGSIHHTRGDLPGARHYYDLALQGFREIDELRNERNVLNNIAGTYYDAGDISTAAARLEQTLGLARAIGEKDVEMSVLGNLASAYRILGDFRRSLMLYYQRLEKATALQNQDQEAWALDGIGLAYHSLGEYERARAFAQRALTMRRRLKDKVGEAVTLTNLSTILISLGEAQQALAPLDKALALRTAERHRIGQSNALINLGRAHSALGDHSKAGVSFDRAIEILTSVGDQRRLAIVLTLRGGVHTDAGDAEEALGLLFEALPRHQGSRNQVGEASTLYEIGRAQHALARVSAAEQSLASALEIIESVRGNIASPILRATFLSAMHHAYQLHIEVLMTLHARAPEKGFDHRALEASEKARARTLLELLEESGTDIREGIDPELRERQDALLERLQAKVVQQQRVLTSKDTPPRQVKRLELELQALSGELDFLETEIRTRSPAYASLAQPAAITVEEIQELLDQDTLFLEYALGEERSFLWAITRDVAVSVELAAREEIESAARLMHRQISQLDPGTRRDEERLADSLGRLLLGPVSGLLDKRRIIVVADGALHYVPFGALRMTPSGATGTALDAHVPLVAQLEILYVPSAAALTALRGDLVERDRAPKTVAILADPVFSALDSRILSQVVTSSGPMLDEDSQRDLTRGFRRLPFARLEADSISGLVAPEERMVALGFEANRAAALSEDIADYRIVHFATHGVLNSQNPELSGLTLSLVDREGGELDGFVGLRDVYRLNLAADLVVLSACQTALGKEIRGEGLVGLTRGFMYVGTPAVVASLWRVSDAATAALMHHFYRGLLSGSLTPAAALREAKLSIMNDPRHRRWRDPYYWAGLTLQGDWQRPLASSKVRPPQATQQ